MRDRHRHRRIVSVSVMIMTHETDTLMYVTFQCILKERSPLHYIILYNAKLRKKIFSISSEQGVIFHSTLPRSHSEHLVRNEVHGNG